MRKTLLFLPWLLLTPAAAQNIAALVSNIPQGATRLVGVVDGGGLDSTLRASEDVVAGIGSASMNIAVPAGGPYRLRVVAIRAGGSFPAVLAGGKVLGLSAIANSTTATTVNLAPIAVAVDPSTPVSGKAGATVTIRINVSDPGDYLDGLDSARIFYSSSPFTNNLGAADTYGTLTPAGGETYQFSANLALPTSPGTVYYQFGEASDAFDDGTGTEAPFFIWPNLETGAPLQQISVSTGSAIAITALNIPPNATRVVAVVDGGGLVSPLRASQDVVGGAGSASQIAGVPAGGPYRVRVIAYRAGDSFPAVLASGKALGITVTADAPAPATVALGAVSGSLDPATPTAGKAGTTIRIKINITDPGDFLDGVHSARISYSSSPFTGNLHGSDAYGTLIQTGSGAYQFLTDFTLPASPGTIYYQFGEGSYPFANAAGTEAPFLFWPNLESGTPLQQISVSNSASIMLTAANLPAAATRVVAVVDGGGLINPLRVSRDVASGAASASMEIGVPPGGPYRVRAIAFRAGGSFPAVLASGKVLGISAGSNSTVAATLALGTISGGLDPSTPSAGQAGATVRIKINLVDPGDFLDGTPSGRISYWTSPFTANLYGPYAYGTLTAAGSGTYQFSADFSLPALPGTIYYQFGEGSSAFASGAGSETPFLIWPNVEAGSPLQQVVVSNLTRAERALAAYRDKNGGMRLVAFPPAESVNGGGSFASDPSLAATAAGDAVLAARDGYGAVWAGTYRFATHDWSWAFGGGRFKGVVSVAVDPAGTAHLGTRDDWNAYWLATYAPSGRFGGWTALGGVFSTDPVTLAAPNGDIYLIGKDTWNALWAGRRDHLTGAVSWEFLGGVVKGNPAAGIGPDGTVRMAIRDNWNSLWIITYQHGTAPHWTFVGGTMSSDPQLAVRSDGTAHIVLLDNWHGVWRVAWTAAGTVWTYSGSSFTSVGPAIAGEDLYIAARDTANNELWWYCLSDQRWTYAGNRGLAAGELATAPR